MVYDTGKLSEPLHVKGLTCQKGGYQALSPRAVVITNYFIMPKAQPDTQDLLLLSHRVTASDSRLQTDDASGTRKINSSLSAPPPSQHSRPSLRSTGWVGEGGVDAAFTGHSAPRLPAIFFSTQHRQVGPPSSLFPSPRISTTSPEGHYPGCSSVHRHALGRNSTL